MSLFQRLMLSISALVLLLLAANAFVSVYNAQHYFSDQLSTLAEDTATSLGLTVSHAAQADDQAQMQSMVDVIFDRGYYREISYKKFSGEEVISRTREVRVEGVPNWFIDFISIEAKVGTSEIVSGWMRLGVIEVYVHPGYAYRDLWKVVNQQLWLFIFAAAVSSALAIMGLRYLLRPLLQVEQQAEAICRKEFPIQAHLPSTPELKRMVLAMNRMVQKIQNVFAQQVEMTETLRRESHMDPLTGLPNRKEFDARINAWMKSEAGGAPSLLVLIHMEGLERVNDGEGREVGDLLVKEIAGALKQLPDTLPNAISGRRAGADFCLFVPGALPADVAAILYQVEEAIGTFTSTERGTLTQYHVSFKFGVATSYEACDIRQYLIAADESFRASEKQSDKNWVSKSVGETAEAKTAREWLQILQYALQNQALYLHFQPVLSRKPQELWHHEVFARIEDEGQLLNAGVFWPLVERYHLEEEMDKVICAKAIEFLAQNEEYELCVNLTPQSLCNEGFAFWLGALLDSSGVVANRLTCEFPEKILQFPVESIKSFLSPLKERGVHVSLDHFGVTPSALGSLQSLAFDYVKIDRRFTLDLEEHSENVFYIKSLLQIAHSCDVKVFADGVENQEDWDLLEGLGLDGVQGYLFAAPKALNS
ncbi:MAG: EAL domain-containing protein [Agarilytica sp.]